MSIARTEGQCGGGWVRPLLWGGAGLLLLAPLVAMQFTREVNWTVSDFLFAALLVVSLGVGPDTA